MTAAVVVTLLVVLWFVVILFGLLVVGLGFAAYLHTLHCDSHSVIPTDLPLYWRVYLFTVGMITVTLDQFDLWGFFPLMMWAGIVGVFRLVKTNRGHPVRGDDG